MQLFRWILTLVFAILYVLDVSEAASIMTKRNDLCREGPGLNPHPSLCNSYYHCKKDDSVPDFGTCRDGLGYSSRRRTCVIWASSDCKV